MPTVVVWSKLAESDVWSELCKEWSNRKFLLMNFSQKATSNARREHECGAALSVIRTNSQLLGGFKHLISMQVSFWQWKCGGYIASTNVWLIHKNRWISFITRLRWAEIKDLLYKWIYSAMLCIGCACVCVCGHFMFSAAVMCLCGCINGILSGMTIKQNHKHTVRRSCVLLLVRIFQHSFWWCGHVCTCHIPPGTVHRKSNGSGVQSL